MSTLSGYGSNIRQSLVSNGINNNDIGYNKGNGYVTVKGQDFMKPSKVLDGVSYDTQNNFNNAWNAYNKSQTQPTTAGSTYNTTGTTSPTSYVPQGMTSTRDALASYGIDNSRIGYNNGATTVDGRYFGTPSANIGGTTYYDQTGFNNALGNYRIGDMQQQILNNTQLPQNAYTAQIDALLKQLGQSANTQSSVDAYSTPEYAAYQAQADRRAQSGIRSAQEALGSAGFGRSTALGERAQGIQNEQTEYLETQVIPMLLANERARKQQEYENMASLLNPLMSQQGYTDQRSLQNLQNQYNALGMLTSEQQRGLDNRRADASLTGTFLTPEQESLINSVLSLKQQAETKGITKDQRNVLSQQANQLRDRMRATGLDPTQYGANVNFNAASQNTPGRTLQGQQVDMQRQDQQFNQGMQTRQQDFLEGQQGIDNAFRAEQFAYQKARDAVADSQWSQQFNQNVTQFGLNYALQQLQQQDDSAYRNAMLGISQDENARAWLGLGNTKPAEYNGMNANQVLSALQAQYIDPTTEKYAPPKDAAAREQIYQQVAAYGLPSGQDDQVMLSMGLTAKEIQEFDKKYIQPSTGTGAASAGK
ncbi:hypothetical protein NKT34_13555 [Paenibacillus polysaccharolyticus]|uniref:hypothetical protein n=1 Tax=Paenibacillus polysaccharolyticus TaxID=582692 RepID=UPI00209F3709|nr:hypothetical protein [Paenibacillus polysaccharolyticus]MCP1134325.1 hypothetical protein [Paenibacillus polysaccharolyticus]